MLSERAGPRKGGGQGRLRACNQQGVGNPFTSGEELIVTKPLLCAGGSARDLILPSVLPFLDVKCIQRNNPDCACSPAPSSTHRRSFLCLTSVCLSFSTHSSLPRWWSGLRAYALLISASISASVSPSVSAVPALPGPLARGWHWLELQSLCLALGPSSSPCPHGPAYLIWAW